MKYTIFQTVLDGVSVYRSEGQPDYRADTLLSFDGITQQILCGGEPLYTLIYNRRQSALDRREPIPRGVYPMNVYRGEIRIGSVHFNRNKGCLVISLKLEDRIFEGRLFTLKNNSAKLYIYENDKLSALVSRPVQRKDDRTVYCVWVNDSEHLPKPDYNDVVERNIPEPDTYTLYPDVKYLADTAALFAIYLDTQTMKPFGEFEYVYKQSDYSGIKNKAVRFNCERDYLELTTEPDVPLYEPPAQHIFSKSAE